MAAAPAAAHLSSGRALSDRQVAEFPSVFRGRELISKGRRLSSGIDALDAIVDGGIARGRVSEVVGRPGLGRTSLAATFAASATRRGEVAAWIDSADAFDPHGLAAAGADLSRILWVGAGSTSDSRDHVTNAFKAAEMVLSAGGFGLVVIDLNEFDQRDRLAQNSRRSFTAGMECRALRLARAAERSGAAVIVLTARRTCGTFAALSLVLGYARPSFSRTAAPGAPALFDGLRIEAYVARNKLGGSGRTTTWNAMVDPACATASSELMHSAHAASTIPNGRTIALPRASSERNRRPAAYQPLKSLRRLRKEAASGYVR